MIFHEKKVIHSLEIYKGLVKIGQTLTEEDYVETYTDNAIPDYGVQKTILKR